MSLTLDKFLQKSILTCKSDSEIKSTISACLVTSKAVLCIFSISGCLNCTRLYSALMGALKTDVSRLSVLSASGPWMVFVDVQDPFSIEGAGLNLNGFPTVICFKNGSPIHGWEGFSLNDTSEDMEKKVLNIFDICLLAAIN